MTKARKQRARQAPDPDRFPPCGRCAVCFPTAAHWPEGRVCIYCYGQARRTVGTCSACAHQGVLPGVDDQGHPTCRRCSGITLSVDCRYCGAEDVLYRAETCWRCALDQEITQLLTGPDQEVAAPLQPLALAIKTMPRANSGITWLANDAVRSLLRALASGDMPLTHEGLDALPGSRTVEYIRGLLMKQGCLPARNEQPADYGRWLDVKLATIGDPESRRLIETFGRWHQLRKLRTGADSSRLAGSSLLRAKQSTTLAIQFLAWLEAAGKTLADCTQHDVDRWFATGPSTRCHTSSFLYWAINGRRVKNIKVPPKRDGNHPAIGHDQRLEAIRRLLLDETLELRWRIAGGLVLLLGQPAQRIATLRTDDVSDAPDGSLRLRVSQEWLELPEPFSSMLREHLAHRPNMATAANSVSPWMFPGAMPGKPISATSIVNRLRAAGIPVLASRNGTWQQLVREAPPSVLADALGISPKTAMQHAARAGADWL